MFTPLMFLAYLFPVTCVCSSMLSPYFLYLTGGTSGAPKKRIRKRHLRPNEEGVLVDEVVTRQRVLLQVQMTAKMRMQVMMLLRSPKT